MVETGTFYSYVIDPILKGMRKHIAALITGNETVIDIACGTGAQVYQMAGKARRVVGVDLSESMIKYAKKKSNKLEMKNVEFFVSDATNLSNFAEKEFDVATMSLAIHQFNPELYTPILNEMKRVAKRIIIVDYAVPLPNNYAGIASKAIEFLAGREHYRCFRRYYKMGGLVSVLNDNELEIKKRKYIGSGAFMIVLCTP